MIFQKKRLFLTFVFILILVSLRLDCLEIDFPNENQVIEIKNPKKLSPNESKKLELKEDLVIGDKINNDIFESIATIRVDEESNIYVLDMRASQIKVFDKKGAYIRSIGKRGQGPGEFMMPAGMELIDNNQIIVSSMGKLSFFSLNGEFQKQIIESHWDPSPGVDSKGNIYQVTVVPGEKYMDELRKYNSNFKQTLTITSIEKPLPLPQSKRNPFQEKILYSILPDDSLVWGINNKYELNITDIEGNLTRKIMKDYDRIKVTEKYKQDFLNQRSHMSASQKSRYEFPNHFPPYRHLSTDDLGNIYVWTYENDDENNRYFDVFNRNGKYISKIKLKSFPTFWKNNKLYFVREGEMGFHQVVRCKVEWKSHLIDQH